MPATPGRPDEHPIGAASGVASEPMGPEIMTGGEAVVRSLLRAGVEVVFGIPGVDNLPIYDALLDAPGLRHTLTRHEQGAGFMADGYARASGRVGVCLTTTGPGALNAATPLAAAYADGSPVLLVASQTDAGLIGRGKGPPHDMRDQFGVFHSLVGNAFRVRRVEEIPRTIFAALRATRSPRPGPAYLEIPADVLRARAPVVIPPWRGPVAPVAPPETLEQAAVWLHESRRPIVIAGGGVRWSDASGELVRLAERLGAPVVTTLAGKGAIPELHPLSFGVIWGRWRAAAEIVAAADLALIVGTRLGAMDTDRWSLPLPERRIQLDIDRQEIGRNCRMDLGLVADARATLRSLSQRLEVAGLKGRQPWLRIDDYRIRAAEAVNNRPELAMVRQLEGAIPMDATVVNDAPTLGYWLAAFWPATSPQSFLMTGFGSLGFGLPAALGVRLAVPTRPILVLCGDGGLLFTGQELATAIHEGLPVVVLLVNDHAYGSVRATQERQYAGRVSQVRLTNPNFVTYAASFGFESIRVVEPDRVGPALRTAFAADRPYLIELTATYDLPPLK